MMARHRLKQKIQSPCTIAMDNAKSVLLYRQATMHVIFLQHKSRSYAPNRPTEVIRL